MTTIADSMIADGVTVLAIVNLDSESGAAIQEKAASQGVKTIDYDRLTLGGSADVLRVLRQHQGRRAAGPGPRGLPRRQGGEHRLPERVADRQQRHALRRRRAQRARQDDATTRTSASRPFRTGTTTRPSRSSSSSTPQADGKVDGVLAANDGLGGARDLASSRGTARPARSRSPARTPPSRACRTSSPAPSA